jgi:undecaprenyl-diphosphatase
MTALQAIILALVQGITELFPISSLGHAVILPTLLGWHIDQNDPGFLPFLAVMHLGTAIALLGYFWRDLVGFAGAVVLFRNPVGAPDRRLLLRVVVATIPAVVIGYVFEKKLRAGFGAPALAAGFLMVNGVMLFVAERLRGGKRRLDQLSWLQAAVIGLWQCLALIPGMSRSGATMAGGYICGLSHEDSARFSFLTATPIILGAVALEAPKLIKHHSDFSTTAVLAGGVAGVTALASVWALMHWFKSHEVRGFDPFALYCALVGAGAFAWLMLGR